MCRTARDDTRKKTTHQTKPCQTIVKLQVDQLSHGARPRTPCGARAPRLTPPSRAPRRSSTPPLSHNASSSSIQSLTCHRASASIPHVARHVSVFGHTRASTSHDRVTQHFHLSHLIAHTHETRHDRASLHSHRTAEHARLQLRHSRAFRLHSACPQPLRSLA